LLADRCILSWKDLLAKIEAELSLPRDAKLGSDSHYRCFHCLTGDHNEDWNGFELDLTLAPASGQLSETETHAGFPNEWDGPPPLPSW
jgi:hypothetical protein